MDIACLKQVTINEHFLNDHLRTGIQSKACPVYILILSPINQIRNVICQQIPL